MDGGERLEGDLVSGPKTPFYGPEAPFPTPDRQRYLAGFLGR